MLTEVKGKRILPGVLLGMIFMTFGMLLMLHNLNILNINRSLRFWPFLTLIPLGLERLFTKGFLRSIWGHILLIIGIYAQTFCLNQTEWLEKWWPAAILWIGLAITLKALQSQKEVSPSICERIEETPDEQKNPSKSEGRQ